MLETFVSISKYINKVSNELEINFENAIDSFLNKDKVRVNIPEIVLTKGNIPLVPELLNKYKNVNEIFEFENASKRFIQLNDDLDECLNLDCKISDMKDLAIELFESNHFKNKFVLDGNYILISKSGIRESIEKIFYNEQKDYLKYHFIILKNLGNIIGNLILVNQSLENKNRKKYNSWNYYIENISINGNLFILEIEIVSMLNGENHYRVQRISSVKNKCLREEYTFK